MATSSITTNFTFSGESAERFANAVEQSMHMTKEPVTVNLTELHTKEEIINFMKKRNNANV